MTKQRIRVLAEQAGFAVINGELFSMVREDCPITPDLEKFAELIIRKCAKVADLAQEHECEWIGGNILTHFGVEE